MKNILKDYFSSHRLKVLDICNRDFYSAVTFPYIVNHVLNKKYHRRDVAKELVNLLNAQDIKIYFCPDINHVVFSTKNNYSISIKIKDFLQGDIKLQYADVNNGDMQHRNNILCSITLRYLLNSYKN